MEPAEYDGVFQNVITNQGGGPGEWYLLPFYCCKYVWIILSTHFAFCITWSDSCNSPATNLTAQMRGKSEIKDGVWEEFLADGRLVWPGDSVKNVFSLDIPSGKWYNNWVVTPGQQGNAAGQKPFGGGFVFDPAVDSESFFHSSGERMLILINSWDQGCTIHECKSLTPFKLKFHGYVDWWLNAGAPDYRAPRSRNMGFRVRTLD
jgi:hypothetical protein